MLRLGFLLSFCYLTPVLCRNPPTGPLQRSLPASQVLALCKWQMVRPCRLPIILAGCKLPECSVSLAKEEMEPTLEFVQWQLWDWHIRAQFPFIHQRRSHCFLALIMNSPEMGKCQTSDMHHKQWLARKPTGYEPSGPYTHVEEGLSLFFSGLQQPASPARPLRLTRHGLAVPQQHHHHRRRCPEQFGQRTLSGLRTDLRLSSTYKLITTYSTAYLYIRSLSLACRASQS